MDSSATPSSPVIIAAAKFYDADIDHLALMIADMLERLIKHNDQIPLSPDALTRFHSRSPPGISILEYLRRIVKYTNLERSCLLITLHYIDQMCARMPRFTISSLTVHRFVIASVAVSTKALCDAFCTNSHYAKIGGIKVAELNVLEREFLYSIDWRLTCTEELLQAYYVNLAKSHSTGLFEVAELTSTSTTQSDDVIHEPSLEGAEATNGVVEDVQTPVPILVPVPTTVHVTMTPVAPMLSPMTPNRKEKRRHGHRPTSTHSISPVIVGGENGSAGSVDGEDDDARVTRRRRLIEVATPV